MDRNKNKNVAALLALFLGGFGAHHYYLGSKKSGIRLLVLGFLLVGWLMAFYEAILLFLMSKDAFILKYNVREPDEGEFVFSNMDDETRTALLNSGTNALAGLKSAKALAQVSQN